MSRWRAAIVALVCTAIVGCTTGPDSTPTPTPTVPANAPSDTNPHLRTALQSGGILRLRVAALPSQWNPLHPDATADTASVTAPLRAPAFNLDSAGRATANPDVIQAVEVTGDDATRVILTLNSAAVWGDGEPVTADDWVATWKARTGRIEGIAPRATDGWDRVDTVSAGEDSAHVVIDYSGLDPDWAEPLVDGPERAQTVADADAFAWDSAESANYAGPYTVSHVDTVQGVITLDPNPLWWGDAPLLEHIVFRVVPTDEAAAAFRNNELDLLRVGTSSSTQERLQGATSTSIRSAPAQQGRLVELGNDGALADEAVRQAILMAIDPTTVASADLNGLTSGGTPWYDPLLLPNQPGYTDQSTATGLHYSTDAANQALDDAGWSRNADGVRERQGQTLALTFAVDGAWSRAEFTAIRDDLEAVGITLTSTKGTADLTPATRSFSAFPLADLPASVATQADLTDYADRIETEMDPVRRADQAAQLSRVLWQQSDEILLFQPPELVATRQGLANIGAGGFRTTSWEDVGWQA